MQLEAHFFPEIGEHVDRLGTTIEDELLKVHRSYLSVLDGVLDKPWLRSLSHITGGGIVENTHRVLEEGQDIDIDWDSWQWPEIFKMIQEDGNVSTEDMIRPFNLGIGLILIIDKNPFALIINQVRRYFFGELS